MKRSRMPLSDLRWWFTRQVEVGVRASCDGHHLFAHDEVVRELLATVVRAERLVGQGLASNDLVLQLDVFRACTRAWLAV